MASKKARRKTELQKHILHAEEKRMKDEDIANIEISKTSGR
jgi:hypothetical protein